jgi:hypothetical protein
MASQVFDETPGKNPTSGGSSETETKDPMVIPCGAPEASKPVTTTTLVGTAPITERKCLESNPVTGSE